MVLAQGCASNAINNKKYTTSNDKEIYLSATVARELRNERSGTASRKHTYTWSKLTTGNYLVLVKSSKTSDAGNFMYRGSDDCAYVDKKSMGTDLIGSTLNTDQQKYIWKVTKSGNTVTLMSLENNYYINGNGKMMIRLRWVEMLNRIR